MTGLRHLLRNGGRSAFLTLLLATSVLVGCVQESRLSTQGWNPALVTEDQQVADQAEALRRLHALAMSGAGTPEARSATRTWRLITGPGYLVTPTDVPQIPPTSKPPDSGCADPRKFKSAFALDPVTLYPYPRSVLRPANRQKAGPTPNALVPVAVLRGVWIQSAFSAEGRPTFVIGACSATGTSSRTLVFDKRNPVDANPDSLVRREAGAPDTSVRGRVPTSSPGELRVDFAGAPQGPYTEDLAKADWDSPLGALAGFAVLPKSSLTIEAESVDGGGSNNFLRKTYRRSDYSGRASTSEASHMKMRWKFGEKRDTTELSFDVRVPAGFPATRGGKLLGICGGTCPTGGRAPTDRQTAAGENDPTGSATGFSARTMWGEDGYLYLYFYNPDQDGRFADGLQYRLKGRSVYIGDGDWHQVRQYVALNDPGKRNGVLKVWFDDQLVLDESKVRFRDDDSYGIDSLLLHSFFGGESEEAAPAVDTTIDMDNVDVNVTPPR